VIFDGATVPVVSVVDDTGRDVATGDPEPWAAEMRELLGQGLPPEPRSRNRTVAAIFLIVGLVAVGVLLMLAGSALGSDPTGGCGGG
jgi:hypothetical protein